MTIGPAERTTLNFGVRAVCLYPQPGWAREGQSLTPRAFRLVPRSSISKTPLILVNGEGIIDRGYRGPLKAVVQNIGKEPYTISAGRSLFQLVSPDLAPSTRVLRPA